MFRRLTFAMLGLALGLSCALAEEPASMDDAKALAIKAVEFLKTNGLAKAAEVFAKQDGGFHDRDLYPFIQSRAGVMLAHGTNPAVVGHNTINMKDVDGKPFPREISALKEPGWVEFRWQHPETKVSMLKSAYVIPVTIPEGEVLVGVGAYKK